MLAMRAGASQSISDAVESSGNEAENQAAATTSGSAVDWAALVASGVILYNGIRMLRPAINDLMDRVPEAGVIDGIALAALGVEEVCAIEKLKVRKVGLQFAVDLHVQADPHMSLHDAHVVSGKVKSAIRAAMPAVDGVLIHMEPYELQ